MTQPPYGANQPYGGPPPEGPPGSPYGQPDPYGQPAQGYPPPGYPPPAPPYPPLPGDSAPQKNRVPLIATALVVVLVLCVGGGVSAWLLLRDAETGEGAAEPVSAVSAFLKAVYTDKNAEQASALVCSEARDDKAISTKVDEIKGYDETYETPRFAWTDPKVDTQNEEKATVSVELKMTTADEKTTEQKLVFTVVQKTGWWVCEVG